jgi:hypothetical protein
MVGLAGDYVEANIISPESIPTGCMNGSPGVPRTRGTLGLEGNDIAPCKGA